MNLKGSKTEQNLRDAFSGESQARNKYTYYASAAKKEGYERISAIFSLNADNEKEHAKIWLKLLEGIGNTEQNLQDAVNGEHHENSVMYPEFAQTAKEEGFDNIAALFTMVGKIEKHHEERFAKALESIKSGSEFKSPTAVNWICRNCGHIHNKDTAPEMCPVCAHPKAYFEISKD